MAGTGGNMMASPVVLAILQALFAALPWNPTSGAVRTDTCDVDAAMTAFHNCVTPEAQGHTMGNQSGLWPAEEETDEDHTKPKPHLISAGLWSYGLWPCSSVSRRLQGSFLHLCPYGLWPCSYGLWPCSIWPVAIFFHR